MDKSNGAIFATPQPPKRKTQYVVSIYLFAVVGWEKELPLNSDETRLTGQHASSMLSSEWVRCSLASQFSHFVYNSCSVSKFEYIIQ